MTTSKLEKIEALFYQYDFMKLINSWSNKEEYNSEALLLANNLHYYDTVNSIQQKVWDIFYNRFCISVSSPKFGRVAKGLTKEEAIIKIGDVDKYLEFSQKIKEILDE